MGIETYSTTPASNTALFPEGMLPSAVNDGARQVQADLRAFYNDPQWIQYGDGDGAATIAFASATSFTVAGINVTAVYHAGRRVKAVGSGTGTIYGTIASSSFSTNTTVNVTWDSGSLQNEALTISIGVLSKDNDSLPGNVVKTGSTVTLTNPLVLQSPDAGAGEIVAVDLDRASASPAANDLLMALRWLMRDAGAGTDVAAKLLAKLLDPTAGSEDAELEFHTVVAGALAKRMTLGQGLQLGAPTGGDPGAGLVNVAGGLRINNVPVPANSHAAKTGAYTVVAADNGGVIRWTTAGFTATLTAAATLGAGFRVTLVNAAASGDVTIDPNGAETLDGLATRLLRPGDQVEIVCDGANWVTVRGRYSFASSELSLTGSNLDTVAHGLGMLPTRTQLILRNKTTEFGYAVGDEIEMSSQYSDTGAVQGGPSLAKNATNVYLLQASNVVRILRRDTPTTAVVLTAGSWRYVARAFVEY